MGQGRKNPNPTVITQNDGDNEVYTSVEHQSIRHVDETAMLSEECRCAMFELNSLCMTRHPDFKAIVHQLSRLRQCGASEEAVRKAVLEHLTFQVACSPKTERDKTLKNWSCILGFPIVQQWLHMSIQQYQTAVTTGYAIRNSVKEQIAGMCSVTDPARFNDLVMEGIVLKVLNTDLS